MKRVLCTILFLVISFGYTTVNALTNGPTQPEYSGFTPSKLESMVDLYTGDFTYAIPLMEIPGPSLSYPLTLGYRGGVQLEQEASWGGLGLCLNPGAINRSVDRYPDDYINAKSVSVLSGSNEVSGWDASIGVSYCGLSVGVNFGERSDQGWHFGLDVGAQGMNFDILKYNQRDGWGEPLSNLQNQSEFNMISNFAGGMAAQAGQSAISQMGIKFDSPLSLSKGGASFSKNGTSIGFSSTSTNIGAFHSESKGISLGFKIGEFISVSIGYRYYKYWIFKEEVDRLYGYLHLDNVTSSNWRNHKMEYGFSPEMARRDLTGYDDFLSMAQVKKAFPLSTADGFNATAEGLSVGFRAYRQDIGDYFGMDRHEASVPEWLNWIDSRWWSGIFQQWIDDTRKAAMLRFDRVTASNATPFVNGAGSYADN